MGNITIYLDDETEKLVTAEANASGLSKSRWIAIAVKKQTGDEWPDHCLELAGMFPDFPLSDDTIFEGDDVPRVGF
jgi:hypothetical protein